MRIVLLIFFVLALTNDTLIAQSKSYLRHKKMVVADKASFDGNYLSLGSTTEGDSFLTLFPSGSAPLLKFTDSGSRAFSYYLGTYNGLDTLVLDYNYANGQPSLPVMVIGSKNVSIGSSDVSKARLTLNSGLELIAYPNLSLYDHYAQGSGGNEFLFKGKSNTTFSLEYVSNTKFYQLPGSGTKNTWGIKFHVKTASGSNKSFILSPNGNASSPVPKTFVINHPTKPDYYLVHGAIEGPEHSVFYTGTAELKFGRAEIQLPDYFDSLTHKSKRSIRLTAIDGFDPIFVENSATSPFQNGRFVVKSSVSNSRQKFSWEVKAVRKDVRVLDPEVLKYKHHLEAFGPYTYFSKQAKDVNQ